MFSERLRNCTTLDSAVSHWIRREKTEEKYVRVRLYRCRTREPASGLPSPPSPPAFPANCSRTDLADRNLQVTELDEEHGEEAERRRKISPVGNANSAIPSTSFASYDVFQRFGFPPSWQCQLCIIFHVTRRLEYVLRLSSRFWNGSGGHG